MSETRIAAQQLAIADVADAASHHFVDLEFAFEETVETAGRVAHPVSSPTEPGCHGQLDVEKGDGSRALR